MPKKDKKKSGKNDTPDKKKKKQAVARADTKTKSLKKANAAEASKASSTAQWFEETFHPEWRVRFKADEVLHEDKSDLQHLAVFKNAHWGTCLLLDGVFQLTTFDEFVYHEMMAHVPLMAHERPKSALVIGGGDGGVLREVLKHPSVEQATLCEIDRAVIDLSLEHFPEIADGAFDDPRTRLQIGDGFAFVRDTDEMFDAIVVDSSEPIGPSAILHSPEFFAACAARLTPDGVLMAQNGLPFSAPDHLARVTETLGSLFTHVQPCIAHQPCYYGGPIAMNVATNGTAPWDRTRRLLQGRQTRRKIATKYWTADVHFGAFALPAFIQARVDAALKAAR
ncbi:MAG: polyamine aminopropyltransferase [Pseudomonadota bacterium]